MNIIALPSEYASALPILTDFIRRSIDGTVNPIKVDYVNNRVTITNLVSATTTTGITFTGSGSDFNFLYAVVAGMNGTNGMLSMFAANNPALKLYLADVTGGTRLWLWDPTQTMPVLHSTLIKPTFAVFGDVLLGDIHALASNPMTYFMRVNTGLPVTATTQFFSAQAINNDTDGGAGIVYAPATGGTDSDGYISLIAYGKGSGTLANSLEFKNRVSSGVVQQIFQVTSNGFFQKIGGHTVSGANGVSTPSSITTDYSSAGRVIANGAGSTYGTIQFGSSNNTTTRVILTMDGTNQRIGIIQGVPGFPLDVTGDINTTGVFRVSGSQIAFSNISGTISLTSQVTNTLPIANGGTNSATALSGSSIIVSNGTSIIQGAAGTTTQVLHGNASGSPTYSQVSLTADVTGILPLGNIAPVSAIINIDAAGGAGSPANTSENTLKTYSMPGGTMANAGDMIRITCTYRCTGNTDTKRIRLYFGATVIADSGATILNGTSFVLTAYVARTGSTSQFTQSQAVGGGALGNWTTGITGDVTFAGASETLSGTIVIKSTVQLGAINALNDVIQDMFLVEYLSAGTAS